MLRDQLAYFAGREFTCVDSGFETDEAVEIVVRPEDIKIVDISQGMLTGKVESIVFKGVHYEISVRHDEKLWLIHSTAAAEVGTQIGLVILPNDIHVMKKVNR